MDDGDFVERLGFPERWKVGRGVLNFPAGLDGISLIESVVDWAFHGPSIPNVVVQEG